MLTKHLPLALFVARHRGDGRFGPTGSAAFAEQYASPAENGSHDV